jgi:hypothetical protein
MARKLMRSSLADLIRDPLSGVLRRHQSRIELGTRAPRNKEEKQQFFDRDQLINDLEKARQRNSVRFIIIITILVGSFAAVIAYAFLNHGSVKPELMLGGTGVWGGGLGAYLMQISRSWGRTDVLLTAARYGSPDTLDLMIKSLLQDEGFGRRGVPARDVVEKEGKTRK